MSLNYDGKNVPFAKELRKHATAEENKLWYDFLSTYKVRFQRQKAIDNFIADFYCHKAKLVIEVDGLQHLTTEGQKKDKFRTEILEGYDLVVIRVGNKDINDRFREMCQYIDDIVTERLRVQDSK